MGKKILRFAKLNENEWVVRKGEVREEWDWSEGILIHEPADFIDTKVFSIFPLEGHMQDVEFGENVPGELVDALFDKICAEVSIDRKLPNADLLLFHTSGRKK